MMPVASATSLRAWEKFEELPVLDHDQRLIGVLRRSALAGAVRSRARPARATQDDGSIAGALAASYWGIVSGLIGATLALLPHVKRISRDKE